MDPETEGTKSRGRPSVVNTMAVSEAALALWDERGYATTGWKEIAEVSGVSVRTLMRHFSSRAELAWHGVVPAAERMAEAGRSIADDVPLHDALRVMVQASVSRDPKVHTLGPSWIHLVANEPELVALAPTAHNPWIAELAAFISQRQPDLPPAVANAVAIAYQSATFAALTEWATHPADNDAADAVGTMLTYLARAL